MATNIGTSTNPWIVEAKINSTTNSNVSLIIQIEAPVINGYANFTNLSVSDLVDNLVIGYSLKQPLGVNGSLFDPLPIKANPLSTTKPDLTCLHADSGIKAVENTNFNLSVSIVDKYSKIKLNNINWNVSICF